MGSKHNAIAKKNMEEFFYVDSNNERQGPVAISELVSKGVTRHTLVWKNGMESWQPAGRISELSHLFNHEDDAVPPPPPTSPVEEPKPAVQQPVQPRVTVTTGQPQFGAGKPDNLLVWSILTTIFCCLPFGIVAIVYSSKVDSLWASNDREGARKAAESAKTFCWVSAGCGLIVPIIYLIMMIAGVSMAGLGGLR